MEESKYGAVYQLAVKGTGFNNPDGSSRSLLIKRFVKEGVSVLLVPEPSNPHDPNAIAVFIEVKRWFRGWCRYQIGYVSTHWAKSFTKRFAKGGTIEEAYVRSYHAPVDRDFPRVSIEVVGSWSPTKKVLKSI